MEYITGVHALNLNCALDTCGDWHQSAIQWERPTTRLTEDSVFGEYGIETGVHIPEHGQKTYAAANHIRALLDLLVEGKFTLAQGMRDDFICNDAYNEEIFRKVLLLRDKENWKKIDDFMCREYRMAWIRFKRKVSEENG